MPVENFFETEMNNKRKQFHERVHAAYILTTSLNYWGKMSDSENDWLAWTYPNSELQIGNDQGANYTTITPKF